MEDKARVEDIKRSLGYYDFVYDVRIEPPMGRFRRWKWTNTYKGAILSQNTGFAKSERAARARSKAAAQAKKARRDANRERQQRSSFSRETLT